MQAIPPQWWLRRRAEDRRPGLKRRRNEQVVQLAESGHTYAGIARRFGVTPQRIGQIVRWARGTDKASQGGGGENHG